MSSFELPILKPQAAPPEPKRTATYPAEVQREEAESAESAASADGEIGDARAMLNALDARDALLARFHASQQPQQPLQTALEVSEPGDQLEQEAEKVADHVMRMAEPSGSSGGEKDEEETKLGATLQRACSTCEDEEDTKKKMVQRACAKCEGEGDEDEKKMVHRDAAGATPPVGGGFETGLAASRAGGGEALPDAVRSFMEPRFGQDFGDVRVHRDTAASALTEDVKAKAFTVGSDVFFREGHFEPGTESGQHLLAHELTHVVQQREGMRSVQREILQREAATEERPSSEEFSVGSKWVVRAEAGETVALLEHTGDAPQKATTKLPDGTEVTVIAASSPAVQSSARKNGLVPVRAKLNAKVTVPGFVPMAALAPAGQQATEQTTPVKSTVPDATALPGSEEMPAFPLASPAEQERSRRERDTQDRKIATILAGNGVTPLQSLDVSHRKVGDEQENLRFARVYEDVTSEKPEHKEVHERAVKERGELERKVRAEAPVRDKSDAAKPTDDDVPEVPDSIVKEFELGFLDNKFVNLALEEQSALYPFGREFLRGVAFEVASRAKTGEGKAIAARFVELTRSPGAMFDFGFAYVGGILSGVIDSVKGFIDLIVDGLKLEKHVIEWALDTQMKLLTNPGQIMTRLQGVLSSVGESLPAVQEVLKSIVSDPKGAATILGKGLEAIKGAAFSQARLAGRRTVGAFSKFLHEDWSVMGGQIGHVVGGILLDVLIGVATGGAGTAAKKVVEVERLLARGGEVAARAARPIIAGARQVATSVLEAVSAASQKLGAAFEKTGGKLRGILEDLLKLLEDFMAALQPERAFATAGGPAVPERAVAHAAEDLSEVFAKGQPRGKPPGPKLTEPAAEPKLTEPKGAEPKRPAEPEKGSAGRGVRPARPSYKIGQSDGGPGAWSAEREFGKPPDVAFQQQVTGTPKGVEYIVEGPNPAGKVKFDGYDPSRNVLLDGKRFEGFPPVDKNGEFILKKNGDVLGGDKIVQEAQRQLNARRGGTPIEWHLATKEKAELVARILEDAEIKGITIVFPPKFLGGG